MKILQIGLSNNLGGIERFLFNLYGNIKVKGGEIDFVIYSGELKYSPRDSLKGDIPYALYRIPSLKKTIKYIYELYKLCKKGEYDVIHIHKNSLANIIPILIAKMAGNAKVIIHSHNTRPSNDTFINYMIHCVNKMIISQLSLTRLACSKVAGDWMFTNKEYKIIHNAIDLKKFSFKVNIRRQIRNDLFLNHKFVIGNVSRISPQKNQIFLIEVFREIYKKNNSAVLLLVGGCGDIYYQKKIEEKIIEYGLQNVVNFLGVRDDVDELYQAMDLVIMPSIYEGLCISAIEAQATGLPCICTDVFPEETKISSDGFVKKSLKDGAREWANVAMKFQNYDRVNRHLELKKAGYEMCDEINNIMRVYCDK